MITLYCVCMQMDELRQKNRSLRHQLNLANQEREKQSIDREKAHNKLDKLQRDQMRLVTDMDLIVKENDMLQKRLDQNDHQVVRHVYPFTAITTECVKQVLSVHPTIHVIHSISHDFLQQSRICIIYSLRISLV